MANDYFLTSPSWDEQVADAWERRRAEVAFARQRVNADLGAEIAQIASLYGSVVSPGSATALGQYRTQIPAHMRPQLEEDPAFQAVVQAEADDQLGRSLGDRVMSGVRGTVRTALAGLDAAYDAIVSMPTRTLVRAAEEDVSFGQAFQEVYSRPGAGMRAMGDLASGNWGEIDLGSGWLPGGEDYARQRAERGDITDHELEMFLDPSRPEYDPEYADWLRQQRAQAPTYKGQPLSVGRFAAVNLVEPGTKPYHLLSGLVDGSMAMFADPASKAGRAAGVARTARRSFSTIENPWGLLNNTHRLAVDGEKVRGFLDSGLGTKLKQYLAESDDFEDVWQLLSDRGRHSTVSRQLVNDIVHATDEGAVDQILARELGASIRERPSLSRHQTMTAKIPGIKRSVRDIRLFADMPGTHITLQNLDDGISDFRAYLINAKVDPAVRRELMSQYGNVETFDELEAVMMRAARAIDDAVASTDLTVGGVSLSARNLKMHERYLDGFTQIRNHLRDSLSREMAGEQVTSSVQLGGDTVNLIDDVTLLSEYTDVAIPLLETSQIRSAVGKTQKLIDHGNLAGKALDLAIKGAEWGMQVWKPLQLIRPAWTMRVLGEQQARFAALGVNNQLSSPISTIAIAVGLKDDQLTRTITGDPFEVLAEYRAALTRGTGGWLDTPDIRFRNGDTIKYHKGADGAMSPEMTNVWMDELAVLIDDNTSRQVARALTDPNFQIEVPGSAGKVDTAEDAARRAVEELTYDQRALDEAMALPRPEMGIPEKRVAPITAIQDFVDRPGHEVVDTLDIARSKLQGLADEIRGGRRGKVGIWRVINDADAEDVIEGIERRIREIDHWSKKAAMGGEAKGTLLSDLEQKRIVNFFNEEFPNYFAGEDRTASINLQRAYEDFLMETTEDPGEKMASLLWMNATDDPGALPLDFVDPDITALYTDRLLRSTLDPPVPTGQLRPPGTPREFIDSLLARIDAGEAETVLDELGQPFNIFAAQQSPARRAETLRGIDAVKHWFWEGEGAQFRERLATDKGRAAAREANDRGDMIDPMSSILFSRQESDRYIDNVVSRVNHLTRGDAEILEGVATGTFGGVAYMPMTKNKKVAKFLRQRSHAAPDTLVGPNLYTRETRPGEAYRAATNTAFEMLMTKPDNRFFRSPMYRQRYWERVVELAPKMGRSEVDTLIARAGEANVPDQILRRLKTADTFRVPKGQSGKMDIAARLDLDEVDTIARAYALDQVRSTLYDLTRRSQLAESLRLVAPFAEAWREVLTTWTKIGARSPQAIRRVQQVYTGAREGGGWISGNDQGFFYTNEYGDEVFAYPGGGVLGKMIGAPSGVDMEASVTGLNLVASSVLPGVGPIVQWSVANADRDGIADAVMDQLVPRALLREGQSGSDFIREQINPFGETPLDFDNVVEQVLPSWATTLFNRNGRIDEAAFENTVAQIMKANVASGRIPPDQVDENYEMAREAAVKLYTIRGLANSTLPTNFRPKVKVEDIHGEEFQLTVLAREYRKMVEKYDGSGHDPQEAATAEFLELYGLDPAVISQGSTRQVVPRETFDRGGFGWELAHADLRSEYDAIFGYLAPLDGEPADFEAHKQAIEDGDIIQLTATQQMKLANNTIGYSQYFAAKEQIDQLDYPQDLKDEVMRELRAELRVRYEGFDTFIPGIPENPDLKVQVEQARRAAADPRLDHPELQQTLNQYFQFRDLVEARLAADHGVGLTATKTGAAYRQLLNDVGVQLAAERSEFKTIWDRVLSREVT